MTIQHRQKRVLLLQGPCSFFFTYLGHALRAEGAEVSRVLFCPGDQLFWRGGGGLAYRGRPEAWPGFAAWLARERGITDLVCLGDGRSWHRDAIAALRPLGIRIHVVEQGYLRPSRLTVERDGTGGHTRFPKTWPEIEALAGAGGPSAAYAASFLNYAAMDVAWNLANLIAGPVLFAHYRPHSIDGPLRDWRGWIGKALTWQSRKRQARHVMDQAAAHQGPVFVFALQLETDFQIRLHGPPGGIAAAIEHVTASFLDQAPADALLIVKQHPLDNGLRRWEKRLPSSQRIRFLDGGDLDTLLAHASGLVTINSTVGLTALKAGVPTLALGTAIYDLPGLTHQGEIARFWTHPDPVDPTRCTQLLRALESIQIPGNFDGPGAEPGARAMATRILAAG